MAGDEEEKKADEDKDLELDLMAEAELLRLTRQYRIMEGDKEAYCEEAQKVLRRQRKILADLGELKKYDEKLDVYYAYIYAFRWLKALFQKMLWFAYVFKVSGYFYKQLLL